MFIPKIHHDREKKKKLVDMAGRCKLDIVFDRFMEYLFRIKSRPTRPFSKLHDVNVPFVIYT